MPIALGILAANGQIPADALAGREFAGELSLTGALRPMRGAFAMACGAARDWRTEASGAGLAGGPGLDGGETRACTATSRSPELYLPLDSAAEAALVPGVTVFGARDLPALCAHLADAPDGRLAPVAAPCLDGLPAPAAPDLADVVGQRGARRALEVAAAGGHHMLMLLSKDPKNQSAIQHVRSQSSQAQGLFISPVLYPGADQGRFVQTTDPHGAGVRGKERAGAGRILDVP